MRLSNCKLFQPHFATSCGDRGKDPKQTEVLASFLRSSAAALVGNQGDCRVTCYVPSGYGSLRSLLKSAQRGYSQEQGPPVPFKVQKLGLWLHPYIL
jgi:hypothetical protein